MGRLSRVIPELFWKELPKSKPDSGKIHIPSPRRVSDANGNGILPPCR